METLGQAWRPLPCCSLKGQFRALAEEEINELQDFANAEGFNANLEMWDLPFFRRKHKEQLFKCVFLFKFVYISKGPGRMGE